MPAFQTFARWASALLPTAKRDDALADFIARMLSHPDEFTMGDSTFTHDPSGVEIWIGDGFSGYAWQHPQHKRLSPGQKLRFHSSIGPWKDALIRQRLERAGSMGGPRNGAPG